MKVFIINLKRSPHRRARMADVLGRFPLEPQFVEGFDGELLSEEDFTSYDRRRSLLYYGTEMTRAEIGCFLSHMSIYKMIAAESIPYALILEDDIDIDDDFFDVCQNLLSLACWDVVRFQAMRGDVIAATGRGAGERICKIGERSLFRIDGHILGASAYLITERGARKMLKYASRAFLPIDHAMDRYWENGIIPFVVRPFPVRPHAETSEIGLRGGALFGQPRGLVAIRRWAKRQSDSIAKRAFSISLRHPRMGRGLSLIGSASARLALRTYQAALASDRRGER